VTLPLKVGIPRYPELPLKIPIPALYKNRTPNPEKQTMTPTTKVQMTQPTKNFIRTSINTTKRKATATAANIQAQF